ncbi:MAG: hypothetical protein VXW37_04540 [Candidatus Thermoplasmatota archaeon]|nr:hypothetical protein [Candidatus Thermoplasmatota archaeon]
MRAWIWALEYFYVSLATVWGQGCKNDVIITIIVYVANIHALAKWVGRDFDDVAIPLMRVFVALAPDNR